MWLQKRLSYQNGLKHCSYPFFFDLTNLVRSLRKNLLIFNYMETEEDPEFDIKGICQVLRLRERKIEKEGQSVVTVLNRIYKFDTNNIIKT